MFTEERRAGYPQEAGWWCGVSTGGIPEVVIAFFVKNPRAESPQLSTASYTAFQYLECSQRCFLSFFLCPSIRLGRTHHQQPGIPNAVVSRSPFIIYLLEEGWCFAQQTRVLEFQFLPFIWMLNSSFILCYSHKHIPSPSTFVLCFI